MWYWHEKRTNNGKRDSGEGSRIKTFGTTNKNLYVKKPLKQNLYIITNKQTQAS